MSGARMRSAALAGVLLAAPPAGVHAASASKYSAMADEIGGLLDEALEHYKKGSVEEAKSKTQTAYFEVFENLEGPIRVNVSAKANYELEEEFSAIRRMFLQKEPAGAIAARIAGFKARLHDIVPELEGGVELVAASGDDGAQAASDAAASPGGVQPAWLAAAASIEAGLRAALDAYERGDAAGAAELVNQTFFAHYNNSLLEVAVRSGISQSRNFEYGSRFSDIAAMIESGKDAAGVQAGMSALCAELRKDLPGLPPVAGAASGMGAPVPGGREAAKDWTAVTAELFRRLEGAVALSQRGETRKAVRAVQDAYFDVFEGSGMEARVGARDAGFKAALEGHFIMLAGQIKGGASTQQLSAQLSAMRKDFEKAAVLLGGAQDSSLTLFFYSLTIILREGIEAILIVTMIVAYLVKTGHRDKLKVIYSGCLSALALSAVTALLLKWVLKTSAAAQETLEGATMLLASGVLFCVSYWLISKAEARRWAAYINAKVGASLSANSLRALWFAAFLAVYREGAETVLFYQALASDTTASGAAAVAGGFAAGCVLLVGACLAMRTGAVKLPLRPFFLFTGALLYCMAFVFAGKGMMELVAGKVFEPRLLAWAPTIPFLGVYPYAQTLLPQAVIMLAAAVGIGRAGRRDARQE